MSTDDHVEKLEVPGEDYPVGEYNEAPRSPILHDPKDIRIRGLEVQLQELESCFNEKCDEVVSLFANLDQHRELLDAANQEIEGLKNDVVQAERAFTCEKAQLKAARSTIASMEASIAVDKEEREKVHADWNTLMDDLRCFIADELELTYPGYGINLPEATDELADRRRSETEPRQVRVLRMLYRKVPSPEWAR